MYDGGTVFWSQTLIGWYYPSAPHVTSLLYLVAVCSSCPDGSLQGFLTLAPRFSL